MQINNFAKKNNTSLTTIRYYIKIGLLIPDIVGNKYIFNESTHKDMELINRLKYLKFSLSDISMILTQLRINNETENDSQKRIKEIFQKNYTTMLEEKIALDERINILQRTISESIENENVEDHENTQGVSTRYLPMLFCPHCNKYLTIIPKEIKDGQIHQATLNCDCGYSANIENGILFIPPNINNIKFTPPDIDRDCYKNLNDNEINSIIKIERWILGKLNNSIKIPGVVLETFINDYCFLYSQLDKLNPDILYILSDSNAELVKKYKKRIDKLNKSLTILYISGDNINLPIKKHAIDVYIDFFNNNNFAKNNDHFIFEHLRDYLHKDSYIIGAFPYVKPHSNSINKFRQLFTEGYVYNYNIDVFIEVQQKFGFQIIDRYSDEPMKKSSLLWHVDGDELRHFCYYSKYVTPN